MNPPSKDVIIFLILSYLVIFALLLNVSWQALAFASDNEGLFQRRAKGKTGGSDVEKYYAGLNPHIKRLDVPSSSPKLRALPYRLVKAGMEFIGLPYRWRGMSERTGVDCSGLVKILFEKFGIRLPHSSSEQFKMGEQVAKSELQIGDLVFFASEGKNPNHVGLYVGHDQFLHAASNPGKVIVTALDQPWYAKRFLGARRILIQWKDEKEDSKKNIAPLDTAGRSL